MPQSDQVREQMRLFAQIAELYKAGLMVDLETLSDPVQALSRFVGGYAFDRQGRSPAYGPIAVDVIEQLARDPTFWQDRNASKQVWMRFEKTLQERTSSRSNPKNNPLCVEGHQYKTQSGTGKVKGLSAVEFVQHCLAAHEYNILLWTKRQFDQDQAYAAHRALRSINGIGPKIASFYLRDVAWTFETYPDSDRTLLQPIDIWVKRVAHALDPASEGKEASWIVTTALQTDVLPEAINAAMWYFGAVVAGSEYRLSVAIESTDAMRQMVDRYVQRVARQMRAWTEVPSAEP
jgi:hypothetical protein